METISPQLPVLTQRTAGEHVLRLLLEYLSSDFEARDRYCTFLSSSRDHHRFILEVLDERAGVGSPGAYFPRPSEQREQQWVENIANFFADFLARADNAIHVGHFVQEHLKSAVSELEMEIISSLATLEPIAVHRIALVGSNERFDDAWPRVLDLTTIVDVTDASPIHRSES